MMVIVLIISVCTFFSISASDDLLSGRRDEARNFIRTCFEQLEQLEQKKQKKLKAEIERTVKIITRVLNARQIDFKKFNLYESQKKTFEADLYAHEIYEKSLMRPKEKVAVWDEAREAEAHALYAYMVLSDEWQQYKNDPLNLKAYEQLHIRMTEMAKIIVPKKGERIFVSGTHAYPSQPDDAVNYDVDRVFFLTLYLLNKELHAERDGAGSSS